MAVKAGGATQPVPTWFEAITDRAKLRSRGGEEAAAGGNGMPLRGQMVPPEAAERRMFRQGYPSRVQEKEELKGPPPGLGPPQPPRVTRHVPTSTYGQVRGKTRCGGGFVVSRPGSNSRH